MESWWTVWTRHPLRTVSGPDTPTGLHVLHPVETVSSPEPGRCWRELITGARNVKEKRKSSGDVSRSRVNCQDQVTTPSCVCGQAGETGAVAPPLVVLELSRGSECSSWVREAGMVGLLTRTSAMEDLRSHDLVSSNHVMSGTYPHQVTDKVTKYLGV